MSVMFETLETRSLMSATIEPTGLVAEAASPEPIALLLPAVQKVREAARRMASFELAADDASGTAAAGASSHSGGVIVGMGDGSVRFGDGSVRFVRGSVNVPTW